MTDNDIIKALECHMSKSLDDCEKCPLYAQKNVFYNCRSHLCESSLDLINRQNKEIDRFGFEHRAMARAINCYIKEVERLVQEKDNLIKTYKECMTDAIKEFAERLKEQYPWKGDYLYSTKRTIENIDSLVKEMLGEE